MSLPTKDDPEFWTQIMTLREPAWREVTEDDQFDLHDAVEDAVLALARTLSTRAADHRAAGQDLPDPALAAPDVQLAMLRALREAQRAVDTLAGRTAKNAGHTGATYRHLGDAWGITRQSARLRWPEAVPKKGEPRPVELELAGGRAEIIELPGQGGYVWEATTGTGVTEKGPEPYGSAAEAAAHAGAFLQRHAYDQDAAHADCIEPHRDADREYVDCAGKPL
ncbi:hypothetical protein OHS70_38410 (plasmid) [Streptomyces sp. NBC_00390]|uniref:hypothetical protein n=1 Tax=Streptomyces sp. NBC_00390 TaxID=2975736 RepID=UPI002E1F8700